MKLSHCIQAIPTAICFAVVTVGVADADGLGTSLKSSNEAPALGAPGVSLADVQDVIIWNVLDRAYPNLAVKWPTRSIAVCWEDFAQSSASDRKIVGDAITASWQAHSGLQFKGWAQCASNNRGIRIAVGDAGPHTNGLGTQIDGKRNGMLLNFTFQQWSPACNANATMRHNCVYSIAVHEFGHAIGFAHEQNRSDTPGDECYSQRQGENGTVFLTPWDPHSVMNYCNPTYNNNGELSELDTFAVQKLYGTPAP